jgi:hypothetical protein
MRIKGTVTRRCALLGATGLVAATGLEKSISWMLISPAFAQNKPKMATEIPSEITTPDSVETRLGTLHFFDGVPDKTTCEKLYDNLDFTRGVEVFLNTMAAASTQANLVGLRSVGCDNHTVLIHEDRVDAKTLLLTPNTQTATLWAALDLKAGPVVVEIPSGVLGLADDHWMRHVTDMGLSGPDKGSGGKYVFLPPGYQGQAPDGYFVARPRTFNMACGLRGFTIKGDTRPAVEAFHNHFKMYPLEQAGNPPPTKIINGSGLYLNTIHAKQTRSVLQTDQRDAGLSSETGTVATNNDGSVDVYFAPTRPPGKENWIQTVPGKSWFVYFRLYSPLQPWFDKSWRPGDIEPVA